MSDVRQAAVAPLTASEAQQGAAAAAELAEAAEQLTGAAGQPASGPDLSPSDWGNAPVEVTDIRMDQGRVRTPK